MNAMGYFTESERKLPVNYDVDVLVCGGGPSGIGASVSAAKNGASVLLIEKYNCLGGQGTMGLVTSFMSMSSHTGGRQIIKGIWDELTKRLEDRGAAIRPEHLQEKKPYFKNGRHEPQTDICPFDPEMYKIIAEEYVLEHNVRLLYHTFIAGIIKEGDTVTGAIIENKSGRQAVKAKRIIDCTGDADICAYAGTPLEIGFNGKPAAASTMFCVDNLSPDVQTWKVDNKLSYGAVNLFPLMNDDEFRVEMTRVNGLNLVNEDDITKGEIDCRRQIIGIIDYMHKNLPGAEKARLTKVASMMSMLRTRRIIGEYTLTADDILNYKMFDDVICMNAYGVDIHSQNGGGCELYWLIPGHAYAVPYRCLVPQNIDNLLTAGRALSINVSGGTLISAACMATGEAAGAAAALSINQGVTVRNVSIPDLQDALRSQNVYLGENEPPRPEGKQYIHIVI